MQRFCYRNKKSRSTAVGLCFAPRAPAALLRVVYIYIHYCCSLHKEIGRRAINCFFANKPSSSIVTSQPCNPLRRGEKQHHLWNGWNEQTAGAGVCTCMLGADTQVRYQLLSQRKNAVILLYYDSIITLVVVSYTNSSSPKSSRCTYTARHVSLSWENIRNTKQEVGYIRIILRTKGDTHKQE